ncbi:DUF47 domain-containing protein [Clostridium chrysemydis]|uniref:DUF47 domain-containing protein n=1 Tax=Clostridium chrysemydis TaxID=2665504 RepID=UPI001883EBAA|nr:DUF47 family protein [Clostridium chrysemydis]
MFNLNPKDDKFFEMFIEQAKIINEAAVLLKKSLENLDEKEVIAKQIGKLEHKGDDLERHSVIELNNAFITPIDREDIHRLVKWMDDILDYIDSTSSKFLMYDIKESRPEAIEMCSMVIRATEETLDLMEELKKIGKKHNKMLDKIKKINEIEHNGDLLYRKTIAILFKDEKDVLNIIKWKDIYNSLENTLDMCEKVAAIVEGVVMKHA